jgi:hypothetical protein
LKSGGDRPGSFRGPTRRPMWALDLADDGHGWPSVAGRQDAGIEDGGVDETAVRPEGPRGSQDVQVGMPIQKLPGGLDGDNGGGKGVLTGIVTEERGHRLPGAYSEMRKKLASIPERRTQDLGEREDFDADGGRGGSPAPGRTRPRGWRVWRNRKGKNRIPPRTSFA